MCRARLSFVTDELVRRLEREAGVGDPVAALHYARALEREGRRAEAARTLRQHVDHAEVREELARYPAWSHQEADAGHTNQVDAEPIVREPRVLWTRRVAGAPRRDPPLLASALGVVCRTRDGL